MVAYYYEHRKRIAISNKNMIEWRNPNWLY